MKQVRHPGTTLLSFLRNIPHLHHFIRLVWRLLRDARVPVFLKGMVIVAGLYVISPYDLLPEALLLWLGLVDDLAVLTSASSLFIRWSPREVVAEHVARMAPRFQQHFRHWHAATWRD